MSITRDQAICRFFCEDYSKENAAKLSKRIEELGIFDVCYENDSNRPVLVHLSVIRNEVHFCTPKKKRGTLLQA